jgi:hypothetical protein
VKQSRHPRAKQRRDAPFQASAQPSADLTLASRAGLGNDAMLLPPAHRRNFLLSSTTHRDALKTLRLPLLVLASAAPTLAACPVAVAVDIEEDRDAAIETATANDGAADDVTIESGVTVELENGTVVTVNSNNALVNAGSIVVENADRGVGVRVLGGFTGSIDNQGSIVLLEDYEREDEDDDDTLDGPFAQGAGRTFARAAERLGRNPQASYLEVDGPAEIVMAAEALNEMQHRLQRYIGSRTQMLGAIAHDLRTPLMRLSFKLEMAPDEVRQRAESDIRQMEEMIARILTFVRDASDPKRRERVDLQSLVESVAQSSKEVGCDVEVEPGERLVVNADPLAMRSLVTNLERFCLWRNHLGIPSRGEF